MKTRRPMTNKVIEANRNNSRRSTGPKTVRGKANARLNAIAHGLFSKSLTFANDQEKGEYDVLQAEVARQIQPRNFIESMQVQEIVLNYWKLRTVGMWEIASVNARRNMSRSVFSALMMANSALDDEDKSPLLDESEDALTQTSDGWDCTELCIDMDQSKNNSDHHQHGTRRGIYESKPSTPGKLCVDETLERNRQDEGGARTTGNHTSVKLTSSLDTVMRYQSMIKRDLYRALEELGRSRAKKSAQGRGTRRGNSTTKA